jgi:hypothetical protein
MRMTKSSDLESHHDQTFFRYSMKSKGLALLILFPVALYGIFLSFEPQLLLLAKQYLPQGADKSNLF